VAPLVGSAATGRPRNNAILDRDQWQEDHLNMPGDFDSRQMHVKPEAFALDRSRLPAKGGRGDADREFRGPRVHRILCPAV